MDKFLNFMTSKNHEGLGYKVDVVENIDYKEKKEEIIESIKSDSENILSSQNKGNIFELTFSENKCMNTRVVTALGFFGIYTINDFLLMDIIDFGKRPSIGPKILECIKSKMDEFKK